MNLHTLFFEIGNLLFQDLYVFHHVLQLQYFLSGRNLRRVTGFSRRRLHIARWWWGLLEVGGISIVDISSAVGQTLESTTVLVDVSASLESCKGIV